MTTTQPRRGRVIALRVVAAIFVLIGVIAVNGAAILPWLAWLPEKTLLSIGLPPHDVPSWLVLGTAIILTTTVMVVAVALQLRRPAANVAALWLIILILGGDMVLDTVQWDIGDPIWFVVYGLFLAIVALHPRRLPPMGPIDPAAAALAAIAAVPLAWLAVDQLRQQFAPADPPNNFHYGMALAAAVTLLGAALGATSVPGRWMGVAAACVMPVLVGVSSIAHPPATSALPTPWAWAAIAWGLAVLVVALRRRFAPRPAAVVAQVEVPSRG